MVTSPWAILNSPPAIMATNTPNQALPVANAVVTNEGKLEKSDDVLGILSWGDIVRLSNLPAHLVNHRQTKANDETRMG